MRKSFETPPINSLEDLRLAALQLKMTLAQQEAQLAQRWEALPEEALKASFTRLLPLLLGSVLRAGAWKLLKEGLGWLFSNRKKSQE